MSNFRERMARFMYGRYGVDDFGKFLNIATLILFVISIFIWYVWIPAMLLWGYEIFRVLSRNYAARSRENDRYLAIRYRFGGRGRNTYGRTGGYNNRELTPRQKKALDRLTHSIVKCPNCRQKIRVPKKKGKICIKCPKCRIEFIKRT